MGKGYETSNLFGCFRSDVNHIIHTSQHFMGSTDLTGSVKIMQNNTKKLIQDFNNPQMYLSIRLTITVYKFPINKIASPIPGFFNFLLKKINKKIHKLQYSFMVVHFNETQHQHEQTYSGI